jgi:hypothetical protein
MADSDDEEGGFISWAAGWAATLSEVFTNEEDQKQKEKFKQHREDRANGIYNNH